VGPRRVRPSRPRPRPSLRPHDQSSVMPLRRRPLRLLPAAGRPDPGLARSPSPGDPHLLHPTRLSSVAEPPGPRQALTQVAFGPTARGDHAALVGTCSRRLARRHAARHRRGRDAVFDRGLGAGLATPTGVLPVHPWKRSVTNARGSANPRRVAAGGSATSTFDRIGSIPPDGDAETFDFDAMTDDGSTDPIPARRGAHRLPHRFGQAGSSPDEALNRRREDPRRSVRPVRRPIGPRMDRKGANRRRRESRCDRPRDAGPCGGARRQ